MHWQPWRTVSSTRASGERARKNLYTPTPTPVDAAVARFHQRLALVIVGMLLAGSIIAYRLMDLSLFSSSDNVVKVANSKDHKPILGRMDIVDRNGQLLATNLQTSSVYADAKLIKDAADTAQKLNKVFPDVPYEHLRHQLASGKSFVWIKRNITPNEQFEVMKLGIPGVEFQQEERRVYPHRELLAHVIGYVDLDNHGIAGLEQSLDPVLSGKEQNTEGPLELSIDLRIQYALHDVLADGMKQFKAKGAAGVVMDAFSGEVLAMASLPDFNPNQPSRVSNDAKFNRATLGVYEMGSTFKTFTFASAINEGKVKLTDMFDARMPIRYGRFTIHDYHPQAKLMNASEIFLHSSNIGTVKIVETIGAAKQQEYLRKLGLFEPVDIELPERGQPMVPQNWPDITMATTSYGHGIAVTPLHMVRGVSAVVNGGRMLPISLLKNQKDELPVGEQIFRPQTSLLMRQLLRSVVEHGTASKSNVAGYIVGGKTGTAIMAVGGSYNAKRLRTSFVSAFPMNNPQYVSIIMFEEPQATPDSHGYATAGWNAAPMTGQLIERIGPILGVEPSTLPHQPPVLQPGVAKQASFVADD
ncbi:penicillin-binding protein 2 [bacterium]|nr:penicillin-binding protein 2 [bacterium]